MEIFDSGSLLAAGLALAVPVLWALSGSLVGKWFADFDESACIAVTFIPAAVVVVPVTLAVAYAQSSLTINKDILPAIALLAAGTILATGFGRVLYQKALTVTDNNNGFVSIFFLLIPAFTCLLSLWMSRWISELKFTVGPLFFLGLGLIAAMSARSRRLRLAGRLLVLAVLLQISIGVATVHWGFPLPLATLHNAGAAFLVISIVTVLRALWPAPAIGMVPLHRADPSR